MEVFSNRRSIYDAYYYSSLLRQILLLSVLKYLGEKQNKCDPFTFLLVILKASFYSRPVYICFPETESINQPVKILREFHSFMVQIQNQPEDLCPFCYSYFPPPHTPIPAFSKMGQ